MIAPVASIVLKLSSSVFIKSPGSSAGELFRAIGVILAIIWKPGFKNIFFGPYYFSFNYTIENLSSDYKK